MNETLISELKQAYLFVHLSSEQLTRVAAKARRVQLAEGKVLFSQGDPADRFFLLSTGRLKLYRLSSDGNEKVIEIINEGNTFAEALMFLERARYPVGCAALADCELIAIDTRDFNDMLRGSVDTCLLLLGELSQRLRGLISEIDRLSLQSATCRVAGYLLHRLPEGREQLALEVPKGVLASRLSVKPETFSRIIKHLSDSGVVTVHGGTVRVNDREALRREAEGYEAASGDADSPFRPHRG
jgi:CRP-like cAMP-binding protein